MLRDSRGQIILSTLLRELQEIGTATPCPGTPGTLEKVNGMEIGYEKFSPTSLPLPLPLPLRLILGANCAYGAYWLGHIVIFVVSQNLQGSYLACVPGLLLAKYLADTGKFYEPSAKRHPCLKLSILAGVMALFAAVGAVVGFCCFGYFSSFQGEGQLDVDCGRIGMALGVTCGLWLTSRF